jgi:hypothetical protein
MALVNERRPDGVLVGTADDLRAAVRSGHYLAVGRVVRRVDWRYEVPVIYVSQRALPWWQRRGTHVASIVAGVLLSLAAFIAWVLSTLGPALSLAALVGVPVIGGALAAARARRSVTVTTTTRVRIK